ncbi:ATP synthase F0 subunit B [Candidatus Puniceispirillum sp.]|nr:ATP synthase F0 subunit B [Candidatus Puniceispirillum sp.]
MGQGIVLESVWVAVGFIVFVVLVWRKGGAALGSMLDKRSEKISSELKEAAALRDDALEELQTFRRLHREAAEEAKIILQSAEATAQRIRETAENKAIAAVKRREQQADAKIKAAEASMVAELRERAAVLAAATASEIITSKLDKEASLNLVDSAAAEIEKLN